MARPVNPERAAAKAAGLPRYSGKACPNGHTERHTASGTCVACQAAAQRAKRGTPAPVASFDELLG